MFALPSQSNTEAEGATMQVDTVAAFNVMIDQFAVVLLSTSVTTIVVQNVMYILLPNFQFLLLLSPFLLYCRWRV